MVKSILKIGVPNGLENGMFQVGKVLVQSLIASFGTTAIAANAVANTVASLEVIPGTAIGLAMTTVVGQCAGAGDYDQAQSYTVKLMKLVYLTMGALNVCILLLSTPIVNFYRLSPETASTALWLLLYHGTCCIFFWPMAFALPNALRASYDVKFTMTVSIISMWLFRILFSYLLGNGLHLGVKGVWIAMTVDWLVRGGFFLWRFRSGRWKNRKLI